MRRFKKFLILLVVFSLIFSTVVFADETTEFYDPAPLKGKKIGVQTGSTGVSLAQEVISDPELVYYASSPDMLTALKSNKIDAFIIDEPNARYLAAQTDGVKTERLEGVTDYIAMAFSKTSEGEALCNEMSDFIVRLKQNGELKRLDDKWFSGSEQELVMDDYESYPDTNGTLAIATSVPYAPFEYIIDGRIVGYEIEVVALFCREYGYRPEFINCDFSGIIAGVTTGKYDMGASGFSITEERKESVYFSEPIYDSYYSAVMLENESAGTSLSDSFDKTFVVENRWKDFLSGALVTIEITVISILAGTALGFIWYLIYRKGNKVLVSLSDIFIRIIDGLPIVVLLMILYYIIFGKSSASGIVISIIGFSLLFACFTLNAMKAGEKTVDPGQYLAAEALGYGNTKAFFRIIFPQSSRYIWPSYISEISSHIKATAVVGYIAVVDITKVGDLIRGQTYDAFFPLISVALSYFIMSAVLQFLARIIERKTDPYKRSKEQILGGAAVK